MRLSGKDAGPPQHMDQALQRLFSLSGMLQWPACGRLVAFKWHDFPAVVRVMPATTACLVIPAARVDRPPLSGVTLYSPSPSTYKWDFFNS